MHKLRLKSNKRKIVRYDKIARYGNPSAVVRLRCAESDSQIRQHKQVAHAGNSQVYEYCVPYPGIIPFIANKTHTRTNRHHPSQSPISLINELRRHACVHACSLAVLRMPMPAHPPNNRFLLSSTEPTHLRLFVCVCFFSRADRTCFTYFGGDHRGACAAFKDECVAFVRLLACRYVFICALQHTHIHIHTDTRSLA